MTNIYNKGRYRSGEWAKHLRPFLKSVSNRRWRRVAGKLIEGDLEINEPAIKFNTSKKTKKTIEVKFILKSLGDRTYSYKEKYRSLRSANDAIRRNNVIEATIIK